MAASITHRYRLEKCLSGDKLDRPPVALWRHFPVDDQSPDRLAKSIADFQTNYDFDFIKVTPASSYSVKIWGTTDEWRGNPEGTRDITRYVIKHPEDWLSIKRQVPVEGSLGDQIKCLQLLVKQFSPHVPVIQTIFSPLSQAKNLVGKSKLVSHIRLYPDLLQKALQTITQTTIEFIQAAAKTGIDGVFYAVQHASFEVLSQTEFGEFCKPYDLQILQSLDDLWLNIGHIHGENIMFDQVKDYPVQILNWHDRQTWPSLAEAKAQFSGVVCGGLRQWETMVLGDPNKINAEASDAIRQTAGTRFILGTGCVIPVTTPSGNIAAARQAVEPQ